MIEQFEIHESILLYDLVATLENLLLSVLKMDHVGDEILRENTTIVNGLHPMQMLVLFDRVFHLNLSQRNNQEQVHVEVFLFLGDELNLLPLV